MKFDAYRENKRKSEALTENEKIYAVVKLKDGSYYISSSYHSIWCDEEFLNDLIEKLSNPIIEGDEKFIECFGTDKLWP